MFTYDYYKKLMIYYADKYPQPGLSVYNFMHVLINHNLPEEAQLPKNKHMCHNVELKKYLESEKFKNYVKNTSKNYHGIGCNYFERNELIQKSVVRNYVSRMFKEGYLHVTNPLYPVSYYALNYENEKVKLELEKIKELGDAFFYNIHHYKIGLLSIINKDEGNSKTHYFNKFKKHYPLTDKKIFELCLRKLIIERNIFIKEINHRTKIFTSTHELTKKFFEDDKIDAFDEERIILKQNLNRLQKTSLKILHKMYVEDRNSERAYVWQDFKDYVKDIYYEYNPDNKPKTISEKKAKNIIIKRFNLLVKYNLIRKYKKYTTHTIYLPINNNIENTLKIQTIVEFVEKKLNDKNIYNKEKLVTNYYKSYIYSDFDFESYEQSKEIIHKIFFAILNNEGKISFNDLVNVDPFLDKWILKKILNHMKRCEIIGFIGFNKNMIKYKYNKKYSFVKDF